MKKPLKFQSVKTRPRRADDSSDAAKNCDHVVIVHGTFAQKDDDEGDAFFQRHSDFWQYLNSKLCGIAQCFPHTGKIFHWSGENSERSRRLAAQDLLHNWLLEFEQRGKHYHIVAHSHGGSVVWTALILAMRNGYELNGLRSWITVGTPFIHFRPAYSKLLLLLPLCLLGYVVYQAGVSATYFFNEVDKGDPEYWSVLTGASVAGLFLALLMSFMLVQVGSTMIRLLRYFRNQEIKKRAVNSFGQQYIGVWSPEDEAINGLIHTTIKEMPALFPRIGGIRGPNNPARPSTSLHKLVKAVLRPVANAYDHLIASPIDDFVWNLLRRKGQGSDQIGATVQQISAGPVPNLQFEPLPAFVQSALTEEAADGAKSTVKNVRTLLGISALERRGVPWIMNNLSLQGSELIHTLYFDSQPVREIIAIAIAKAATNKEGKLPDETKIQGLTDWFSDAYKQFSNDLRTTSKKGLSSRSLQISPDEASIRPTLKRTLFDVIKTPAMSQLVWLSVAVVLGGLIMRSFLDPFLPSSQVREVLGNPRFYEVSTISVFRGGAEYDWREIENRFVTGWGATLQDIASKANRSPLRGDFLSAVGDMISELTRGEQTVAKLLVQIQAAHAYAAFDKQSEVSRTVQRVLGAADKLEHRQEVIYLAVAELYGDIGWHAQLVPALDRVTESVAADPVGKRSKYKAAALGIACQFQVPHTVTRLEDDLIEESKRLSDVDTKELGVATDIHLRIAEAYTECGKIERARQYWDSALNLLQKLPPPTGRLYFQKRLIKMLPLLGKMERATTVVDDLISTIKSDETGLYAAHDAPEVIPWLEAAIMHTEADSVRSLAKEDFADRSLSDRLTRRLSDEQPILGSATWLPALVTDLAAAGRLDDAIRLIQHAQDQALRQDDGSERSSALAQVAISKVNIGQFRRARLLADQCLPKDRLDVYSAILRQYWRK